MRTRIVRAVLALCLAALAVSCAVWLGGVAGSDVLRMALDPTLWNDASGDAGAFGGDLLPEGFGSEVLALEDSEDVRVDASACVVGFTMRGEAAGMFEKVARELEGKGWTQVDSGMPACGTFVKRDGSYQWLFVSGVQVGEDAGMVVHYDGNSNGKG
ncbi:hypothetical protein B5F40_01995 [Gordonibacter sp. An230]|uniref:hypothetical protein n=1 Tax=Gordonibacter sp. An230 TaxID=1965592 RepID=UPI000B394120|nr:hypothetical protein [Gordonibacter sp. An230]OUO92125.1 hypothetical protein B5F40_01995 [Gordonibacter sp. An230]